MAIANIRLSTTGLTTVFASPRNTAVTTIIACNTGAPDPSDEEINACELTLHIVPNGQVAGDSTTIVKSLRIPAGETVFFSDEKVVLGQGDVISAQVNSGNLLTITISTLPV
jgi:hypothetical protein